LGKKLTRKQEVFVREYLLDSNATRAAIAAGYSPKTAEVQGYQLLQKTSVSQAIAGSTQKLLDKYDASAERIVKGLCRIAFLDARQLFRKDGSLKPVTELDEDTQAALQAFDVERLYRHFAKGQAKEVGTLSKIKLADRIRALELLGKHAKMFTDRIEFGGALQLKGLGLTSAELDARIAELIKQLGLGGKF
jgi:phage terminase small subunit